MSVIEAPGITIDLDGPLPVARRHSLLRTAGVIADEVGPDGGEPRWMNGVNVYGYPEGTPSTWEPCSTGTSRVKDEGGVQSIPRFDPIAVYLALTCSTIGMTNDGVNVFYDRARRALLATLSHGIEAALAGGTAFSNNPFIGDGNFLALAPAAVRPAVGLSYLENAIGARTGRQGMIHATPAVVSAWGFGAGLDDSDVDAEPEVSVLRGAAGTPIVSGSGYIGIHPLGPGGLPGPNDTSDWVFATGQVEVRLGAAPDPDVVQVVDRTINEVTVRPERYVLAEWDTALQVGVLVDWSLA